MLHRLAAIEVTEERIFGRVQRGTAEADVDHTFVFLAELEVFAGQDGVEEDAHDGGDGQAGEGNLTETDGAGAVGDTDGEHQHEGGDDDVEGVGEVHSVLDDVTHTDGGNHTVEHEGDTADRGDGHRADDGRELGREGEEDGQAGGDAHHAGVEDLGDVEHAGVFAVGRVGGSAEQGSDHRGETVTHQGAMQAGLFQEVLVGRGGNRADVADVLDHRSQGNGDDGDDGAQHEVPVGILEDGEHRVFHLEGETEPSRVFDAAPIDFPDAGGENIGDHHTQEDGDNLDHFLAPDVADDDGEDGDERNPPVVNATVDGHAGEVQTDGDDDGAGDDGREKSHHLAGAESGDKSREDEVHQAGEENTQASVGEGGGNGQSGGDTHFFDSGISAEEGEGGAEEGRNFPFGHEMENQGADTREEQGGGDGQTGDGRDQNGGAEHGEHVLETEESHSGRAQGPGIVDGLLFLL